MKRQLRRWLLGPDSIPQYVAVGIREPQDLVTVTLEGLGNPIDVTRNNSVASLRPLLLALTLPSNTQRALESKAVTLRFRERAGGTEIGRVRLRQVESLPLNDTYRIALLRPTSHSNRCLSPVRLRLHYLYRWWADRKRQDAYNFKMARRDLHTFYVVYSAPRPVSLISVRHQDRGNLFPMDLIGPTAAEPTFLLALRNTSPSVPLMKESGHIALSRIPVEYTPMAYQLGAHHKLANIDWTALPFPTRPSATLGLPVPSQALSVVELQIETTHAVGSHTLFVTRPLHDERLRDGLRMAHVQGFYQNYLKRAGRPLPVSS